MLGVLEIPFPVIEYKLLAPVLLTFAAAVLGVLGEAALPRRWRLPAQVGLAFAGLAYSLFPYLVMDRMTLWQAAAAPESLLIMLVGAAITHLRRKEYSMIAANAVLFAAAVFVAVERTGPNPF